MYNIGNQIDSRIKTILSKRKRNWRKLIEIDPIPRLVRLYELLDGYDQNKKDYYTIIGIRNFVLSVIIGCLVQQLFEKEIGVIFHKHDLLQLCKQLPIVDTLEDAITIGRKIYEPNNEIRIIMSTLWCTDLMRSI